MECGIDVRLRLPASTAFSYLGYFVAFISRSAGSSGAGLDCLIVDIDRGDEFTNDSAMDFKLVVRNRSFFRRVEGTCSVHDVTVQIEVAAGYPRNVLRIPKRRHSELRKSLSDRIGECWTALPSPLAEGKGRAGL